MDVGTTPARSFNKLKELLSSTLVPGLYDPNSKTIVSAHASSNGLGAVLLQEQGNGAVKQVSYNFRSLSPTEE